MVDVGGNLGHVALEVARVHKHVRVVVEDREIVLKESKAVSNAFSYTKLTLTSSTIVLGGKLAEPCSARKDIFHTLVYRTSTALPIMC